MTEVNSLLQRFNQMQQMLKKMGRFQKLARRMGGLPPGLLGQ